VLDGASSPDPGLTLVCQLRKVLFFGGLVVQFLFLLVLLASDVLNLLVSEVEVETRNLLLVIGFEGNVHFAGSDFLMSAAHLNDGSDDTVLLSGFGTEKLSGLVDRVLTLDLDTDAEAELFLQVLLFELEGLSLGLDLDRFLKPVTVRRASDR